jgi:hypothetical protein
MEHASRLTQPAATEITDHPTASAAFTERLPEELEALEYRLESAIIEGTAFDLSEPCVWYCACFLIHGHA